MQFALSVVAVAAAHFFGTFMLAFITGTTQSGNQPLVIILNILTFPLWLLPVNDDGPLAGPWGWLLWIGLSLLWGVLISTLISLGLARLRQAQ